MPHGLQATNLHKHFGAIQALNGLSLAVEPGQLIGFLGPNGAGKTTTMRAIVGLTSVDDGSITWNNTPVTTEDRKRIGYMPQDRGLYPRMKVHEHITFIGRLAGLAPNIADRRAEQWCERVGLSDRSDDLIQELSTGNQQRVQLAVALVHEPELLILDEPFAGLDPVAVSMLSDVMHEQVARGTSVIFSSHQLDLVQDLTEQVTIVANGTTQATGHVTELRERSPVRKLRIDWREPAPDWRPDGATRIETGTPSLATHTTTFELPADADPAALIAQASTHGAIASVTYEPPPLSDVFLGLVGEPIGSAT